MNYSIEIPDEQVSCITAAMKAHNRDLPQEVWDEETGGMVPNPALIPDEAGYVQFVMGNAATSYCNQYPLHDLIPDPTPAPTPAPPPAAA